ncbi:hypothetical protein GF367_00190 [Candidatus Woesearchaeota archaeon]|nr:hypothetical protein [Candidatus Woesearchaeota archaeon]
MTQQSVKRKTAYLCTIKDLQDGRYVRREGWEPNFFATTKGMVSRARLSGVVVEQQGRSITIDDGTGQLPLRVFDAPLPAAAVGDPVMVIGRPRVYNKEPYMLIEILKRVSPRWLHYFERSRSACASFIPPIPEVKEPAAQPKPQPPPGTAAPQGKAQQLVALIRELDAGDGAPADEVISKAGFDGAEQQLQSLITEGEVFELRAGKIKVLE